MEPRSLSATALNVADLCLARYKAEHIDYARGPSNEAASLGTAVHGALEEFVTRVKLKGETHAYDKFCLSECYRHSYEETFQTLESKGETYDDGLEMLFRWFDRTDLLNIQVLTCEQKESFPVPTSLGEIPFNYIWDRCDQISETEYRVVDYKTNRWGLRPDDLKKKIQARAYSLAAQIKFPHATRIWVEFDMLRHDPIGIVFTRDENAATWKFIKQSAQKIIETPSDLVPETLNPECKFCVRKQACSAFTKNCNVGGIASIVDISEAIERRAMLEFQNKAIEAAIKELDEYIFAEAEEKDVLEFETDLVRCGFTARTTRSVDAERVEKIAGPELFSKYGGLNITMGQFDKLLKDKTLTADQRVGLQGLVYKTTGDPRVKIEPKNLIDNE